MRYKILFILLIMLSVYSIYSVFILKEENNLLKDSIPYLAKGESIGYFELLDNDGKAYSLDVLKKEQLSLIFIFKTPCSACNKNYMYWNKIARVLKKDGIVCYGVILSGISEMVNFHNDYKSSLEFKLYSPEDLSSFKKEFRVRMNSAQTILVKGKNVKSVNLGELNSEDYLKIIKSSRSLLKRSKI